MPGEHPKGTPLRVRPGMLSEATKSLDETRDQIRRAFEIQFNVPPRTHLSVTELAARMAHAKAVSDELTLRRMLAQWVSESDPRIVYQCGEIIGLCRDGDPTASIVVYAHLDPRPIVRRIGELSGVESMSKVSYGQIDD